MNTNPSTIYDTTTLSTHGVEVLLAIALACLVLGILLVQKHFLLSLLTSLTHFGKEARPAAAEAL